MELQPNELPQLGQRSLVLAFAGDFEAARASCRAQLARVPNSIICHTGVAFTTLRLGEPVTPQQVRDIEGLLGSNRLVAVLPQLALLYSRVGYKPRSARSSAVSPMPVTTTS